MRTTRQLLACGNAAHACGDRRELGNVARELARRVGDPLRDELLELAASCHRHQPAATRRWPRLRDQVYVRVELAGT